MKKAYFQYYESFENILQNFQNPEEQNFVRLLIINYGLFGTLPENLTEIQNMAFCVIKEMIDDQVHRRETNIKNAQKKNNKSEEVKSKENKKPTVEEITEYCESRKNGIDARAFFDFYESKGWKVGNQPMKDWKACVRTWEQRRSSFGTKTQSALPEDRLTL